MPSSLTRLNIIWTVLQVCFLVSGIFIIAIISQWKSQFADVNNRKVINDTLLRSLVVRESDMTIATINAVVILISFLIGVFGFLFDRPHGRATKSTGLTIFCWALVATNLMAIITGTHMWFFTLRQRVAFEAVWLAARPQVQLYIQNKFECCGYWSATRAGLFTIDTGFCLPVPNVIPNPCVDPFTKFTDFILQKSFTVIYAFTAINTTLLLTTMCLIVTRREEERFLNIDRKFGTKGGFV